MSIHRPLGTLQGSTLSAGATRTPSILNFNSNFTFNFNFTSRSMYPTQQTQNTDLHTSPCLPLPKRTRWRPTPFLQARSRQWRARPGSESCAAGSTDPAGTRGGPRSRAACCPSTPQARCPTTGAPTSDRPPPCCTCVQAAAKDENRLKSAWGEDRRKGRKPVKRIAETPSTFNYCAREVKKQLGRAHRASTGRCTHPQPSLLHPYTASPQTVVKQLGPGHILGQVWSCGL